MKIQSTQNINFQHKILIDIGASNPKGTLKISTITDAGKKIFQEKGSNSYVNNTVNGFENGDDFMRKLANVVKRTYDKVLAKDKNGEFVLSTKDKLLSGLCIFVPGTTFAKGDESNEIAFMPNLRDKNNIALKNMDFSDYENDLKTNPEKTGIKVNKDDFKFVVTKDLGGAGIALANMLAQKNQLNEGDYVMGIMTGGGFGSVDIKVKNGKVQVETSESSSYIAGNYAAYDQIIDIMDDLINSDNPESKLKLLKKDNNRLLRNKIQVLGKLGRQGVNVKSHIGTFCTEIGRKDLFKLLQAVGDARIVEMNRMCVSEKDTELVEKIRSMKNEFREIESTSDGKVAFEMNEDYFGKDVLKRARTVAVKEYANAISLISINKIDDCINKVVLMGPFAHGINQYVKTHSSDFMHAKDLPDLIKRCVAWNINEKHVDLPSTKGLKNLYKFEVVCESDLNIPDNTAAGNIFLNPNLSFTKNRGSWFEIDLQELKKTNLVI